MRELPDGSDPMSLGSRNLGPGKLPAPFQDAPIEIWGQSRDEWRARHSRPTTG